MSIAKITSFESIECHKCFFNPSETQDYFFQVSLTFTYDGQYQDVTTQYWANDDYIFVVNEYGDTLKYWLSDSAILQIAAYFEKRLSKRKIGFYQTINGVVTQSPYPHFYAGVIEGELRDMLARLANGGDSKGD